jgi:hypothetical protein
MAETLVERTRSYVALAEPAPDVGTPYDDVERCEIRWWRGYVKSQFYALAVTSQGRELVLAWSPTFRWHRAELPPPTKAAVDARTALIETMAANGWRLDPARRRDPWFGGTFQVAAARQRSHR